MECKYGERGSLTVYCINATATFIKASRYRYDHLDETFKCINCDLNRIEEGTFDIAENQLKTVDIRNSSITIIYRRAFIGLVYMEALYLSDNPINDIYQGAFSGIRKVKHLEMENAISQLKPEVFRELILLKVLILRNNNLTTIEDGTFEGLRNLKILDLSNNKLVTIGYIFNPLVSLEILKLTNNTIKTLEGNEFESTTNLLGLYLDYNRIKSINSYFSPLNKIQTIMLASNNLLEKSVKLGAFQNLNTLEVLDMSSNNFSVIPNKFFIGLYSLRSLCLYGNFITEFSTGKFSGLPHLRSLNLSYNRLEIAKVTGRLQLTSLHELDLSKNHIQSFDYVSLLERFPKLSQINLSNNNLTCEIYIALKSLLEKDNIYVLATEENLSHCSKDPKLIDNYLNTQFSTYESERSVGAIVITILVLIILLIVLISILFYVEFFVLSRLRYSVNNVRIISR